MTNVNVLNEIIEWSKNRPRWQRDALRRLSSQGELNQSDIADLVAICKQNHGLIDEIPATPLCEEHLPEQEPSASPISLISLRHNSGVNALAQNQTLLFGGALTVVYGANAAGKSGYTRILKRACRARGAEEILGNVTSGGVPGRPSATIKYKVDETENECLWDDDNPPNVDLSRVSVFDRHCASVYVTEQTDVAYRPLGLDLFDKLSNACEAVRHLLEEERKKLETAAAHLPEVKEGTKTHSLLSRLTSLTKIKDVTDLATLTEAESKSIETLRNNLRDLNTDDPQRTARQIEIKVQRAEKLASRISIIEGALSSENIVKVFEERALMLQTKLAAEAIQHETLTSQPLPNTGSLLWKTLWKAAEEFSNEEVYPEETFPYTEVNSRCMLCQQKLSDEAVHRFTMFYEYLHSEAQRERET